MCEPHLVRSQTRLFLFGWGFSRLFLCVGERRTTRQRRPQRPAQHAAVCVCVCVLLLGMYSEQTIYIMLRVYTHTGRVLCMRVCVLFALVFCQFTSTTHTRTHQCTFSADSESAFPHTHTRIQNDISKKRTRPPFFCIACTLPAHSLTIALHHMCSSIMRIWHTV